MSQEQSPFLVDRFIQSLRDAQTEVESFRVQLALGKAEAADKYEEVRADVAKLASELRDYLRASGIITPEGDVNLTRATDELKVQSALGATAAKEALEKGISEVSNAIREMESKWDSDSAWTEFRQRWMTATEVAKTKLEILRMKASLGKLELKSELEAANPNLSDSLEELSERLKGKYQEWKEDTKDLAEEIQKAFDSFRKESIS